MRAAGDLHIDPALLQAILGNKVTMNGFNLGGLQRHRNV